MDTKNRFKEYYDQLTDVQKIHIRSQMDVFGVPQATFYQKLNRNGWRTLEKFKLAELAKREVLEFFPELKNQIHESKL